MKTSTLKKSILDYAIKGELSAKFRRENPNFSAFAEIEMFNQNIEKQINELNKKLDSTPKSNKENLAKLKAELKKLKKIELLNSSDENSDFPFKIPESWVWVKLGDICEAFTGNSINADKKEKEFTGHQEGLNYIGTKDINIDKKIIYENGIKIPYCKSNDFKIAKKYSTLLCLEGGSAGKKIGFLEEDVCFGNKLCCFEASFCNAKFLYFYLQNPNFLQEFNLNLVGIIGGVGKDKIKDFLIPLPPLQEQGYIVKTLDSLFELSYGLK